MLVYNIMEILCASPDLNGGMTRGAIFISSGNKPCSKEKLHIFLNGVVM